MGATARIYSWYGIGQSLLMLPADLVGDLDLALANFRRI